MKYRDFSPYQLIDYVLRQSLRRMPVSAWTEQIAVWWGTRYQAGPKVVKLRDGVSVLVEPRDFLLLSLYYLGTFEPYCLRLLPRLLRPGDTMIDVGANIGLYTLAAAKIVGPQGSVIALEPAPSNADALRGNIIRNGFTQVKVFEAAAGPENGHAKLTLPHHGNSGMFTLGDMDGQAEHRVSLHRLDDVVEQAQVDRVDLVKMDIEGSEYGALLGAPNLLDVQHPSFIIELNDPALRKCGSSADAVKRLFHEAGYKGWIIKRHGLVPIVNEHEHHCDECIFIYYNNINVK